MDFKEELAGMNLPGHFVEAVTAAYGALVESESVLTAKVTFNNEDSAFDALDSLNQFKELNIHPECSGYIDEVEFSKDGCSIVLKSASADALKYVRQFTEEADEDALVGDSIVLESIGCPVFEGTVNSEQMVERLINWVTHVAPFPRDKVAEFIDANRTSHLVRCAMSADFFSSYQLVKYIGTWLGLPGYEEAETVDDVLKANKANRKESLPEASGSPSGMAGED